MNGRKTTLAGAVLLLIGCASAASTPAGDAPPAAAGPADTLAATSQPQANTLLVAGRVTNLYGYPVDGAAVTVRVGEPKLPGTRPDEECRGATNWPSPTRSGPTGEFRVRINTGAGPAFQACLEVEALPPPRVRLQERRVIVPAALFAAPGPDGAPRDTVLVRVSLF